MTKTSSGQDKVRPTILFSQTPHSVARRARGIANRTAAELLRYLCELTIGFGRGFIDLTYRALAMALQKSWRAIARAAKLLRTGGDVEVEALDNGSYRWYVPLEPEEILKDPREVYRVRKPGVTPAEDPPMTAASWGYDAAVMGGMTTASGGEKVPLERAEPVAIAARASSSEPGEGGLKKDLKDTNPKIHHQDTEVVTGDVDEVFGHKDLLRELLSLGTGQRVARRLLREHDHKLISRVLEKVRYRDDLENRAGYLVQEVIDGGYRSVERVKPPLSVSRETSRPAMQSLGVERTRAEQAALAEEKKRQSMAYREQTRVLLQRFRGLTEDFQLELKKRWTRYLSMSIPRNVDTSRQSFFEKVAFREIATRFFELVDEGLSDEQALRQLAAA